jgi:YidC/Oxa1 family membrane protein insertase
MWLVYLLVKDFGWAVIIFTLLIKAASFPLTLKQQRNMAVSQLFTPRVQEIQRKHRGNQAKMQEEMQKLQKEGYNPMGGCGPMILTMIILFGVLDVVYRPMTHIERLHKDTISEIVQLSKEAEFTSIILSNGEDYQLFMEFTESNEDFKTFFAARVGDDANPYEGEPVVPSDDALPEPETIENEINIPDTITVELRRQIGEVVLSNIDTITARNAASDLRISADNIRAISNANRPAGFRQEILAISQFSQSPEAFRSLPAEEFKKLEILQENMVFLGFINLAAVPQLGVFDGLWIIVILSFGFSVVQVLVQRRIQRETMPANMPNAGMMKGLMFMGPAFALIIVFQFPAGAGLYWAISNLVMIVQSLIIFKVWPPERMRREAKDKVQASLGTTEITAKVTDIDEEGNEVKTETKISDMSKREQDEYFKKKLEAARKADLEKYGDESQLSLDNEIKDSEVKD